MDSSTALETQVMECLKEIYDPEIPVNIVDLGLIYQVTIKAKSIVIQMTLTNPMCPVANEFPNIVESHLAGLQQFDDIKVNLVFDPPWSIDKISESAKLILGI